MATSAGGLIGSGYEFYNLPQMFDYGDVMSWTWWGDEEPASRVCEIWTPISGWTTCTIVNP